MARRPPPENTRTLGDIVHGIVADIREKVVEEPWFGRALEPGKPIPHFYEVMWGHSREPEPPGQHCAKDEPEIDR